MFDQFDAQTFDVHGGARCEVTQSFSQLGRTAGVRAPDVDPVLVFYDVRLAFRALRREFKRDLRSISFMDLDSYNMRDDLARLFNDDPIVDLNPQSFDFIPIVQAGARDGGPRNFDRFEQGNRGQGSGFPDADQNLFDLCFRLVLFPFVGDDPTW